MIKKDISKRQIKVLFFLDEIGETPLETQVKLLRVLENGEFMRVGEAKTRKTDVRLIAATNKDLHQMVSNGEFRQDLYFRLKTVTVLYHRLGKGFRIFLHLLRDFH